MRLNVSAYIQKHADLHRSMEGHILEDIGRSNFGESAEGHLCAWELMLESYVKGH